MAEWVTVQPSLDPILAPVNGVLAVLDGLLSAILVILNIVQTILNIIKAFLLGLLNPLKAIIKAIIAEIRAILNDLKQLGLYIHIGDLRIIDVGNQFRDVRGGFDAFERRMIARLTNKKDITRPNFSSNSAAIAGFFYVSGQDIDLIVRTLTAIYNLFMNRDYPIQAAFPQPVGLASAFGGAEDGFASFADLGQALAGKGAVPEKALIKWKMPAGPGPGAGFKSPVPKGWLIEVSTISSGLKVTGATPLDRNAPGLFPTVLNSVAVDPVTNGILEVYGGSDMVGDGTSDYSNVWPPNPEDPRAPKLYFQKDTNTPLIPPKALSAANGGPWLGAAFYVHNNPLTKAAVPGQEFNALFDVSMLPKDADITQDNSDPYGVKFTERTPDSYFFRVRAVAESVDTALGKKGTPKAPHPLADEDLRLFKFTTDNIRQATNGRLVPSVPSDSVGASDFGIASASLEVAFPGGDSVAYMQAIQLALIVMLLSRSDARTVGADEVFQRGAVLGTTGLEEIARKLNTLMKVGPKFYEQESQDWNRTIYRKTRAYAQTLYDTASLSTTLMGVVVELAEPLFTTTWRDMGLPFNGVQAPAMTIAQTFGIGDDDFEELTPKQIRNSQKIGAAPNPMAISVSSPRYTPITRFYSSNGGPERSPGFQTSQLAGLIWRPNNGSLDSKAPVIYKTDANGTRISYVQFARNLFLEKPEVLAAAAGVLKVTASALSPKDGNWIVTRPLYELMEPLDAILTNVEAWLLALLGALDGIIEQIVAFIEAVQARIYQLQALIEWIRSLLKALDFNLPSASGLVVVANGTDGILKEFISAENKPQDDPQSIGCGLVVVAGGLPNFLLDALAALLGGGGD